MPFVIPSQADVEEYMKHKKPEWPASFIGYYSERFIGHYTSNGWKVGRNAMKDWRAAFNSQWQVLKFKEDVDRLAKCQADVMRNPSHKAEMRSFVNLVYENHKMGKPERKIDVLVDIYTWLKQNGLAKLPVEVIERIARDCGPNRDMAKAMSVHEVFNSMVSKNIQRI